MESRNTNARDAVSSSVVDNVFGDIYFARVSAKIGINSFVSHCDAFFVEDIVIDTIYFEVMCPEACGSEECHEKK
jgi:hypothetical protein